MDNAGECRGPNVWSVGSAGDALHRTHLQFGPECLLLRRLRGREDSTDADAGIRRLQQRRWKLGKSSVDPVPFLLQRGLADPADRLDPRVWRDQPRVAAAGAGWIFDTRGLSQD